LRPPCLLARQVLAWRASICEVRMPTIAVSFLADIIAHPDDDSVRLIYADWLDEQGQGERAEFIRAQCEFAKISATYWALHSGEISLRLFSRQNDPFTAQNFWAWFATYHTPWMKAWPGTPAVSLNSPGICEIGYFDSRGDDDNWTFTIRRGFPETIELPAKAWLEHWEALRGSLPLRHLRLKAPLPVGTLLLSVALSCCGYGSPDKRMQSFPRMASCHLMWEEETSIQTEFLKNNCRGVMFTSDSFERHIQSMRDSVLSSMGLPADLFDPRRGS